MIDNAVKNINTPKPLSSQPDASIRKQLRENIKQAYQKDLIRSRLQYVTKQDVYIKGRVNFSSNDYLGLATNPEITKRASELLPNLGIGSGASNLISGYHTIHQDLENEVCSLLKCEQAVIFPSGYMANLAIADVLLNLDKKNSIAIHDHNNHASLIDGTKLSGAKFARYQHNNIKHLQLLLEKHQNSSYKYLFTEGLFSMDGDFSDLKSITKALNHQGTINNNCLIVDESHSFGLYNNARSYSYDKLNPKLDTLIMGTFGKAMGCAGAFVAGPKIFIQNIIQFARAYIYTTAISPIIASAALHAIKLNQQTSEFRDKLFGNIDYFCQQLINIGIQPQTKNSPIQPLIIGDAKKCKDAALHMEKNDIILTAIRAPTVASNKSRLRITLSASHSHDDIDCLIKAIKSLQYEGLIKSIQ